MIWDHCCGLGASLTAGPGSIPGRVSFPGWDFFQRFSSTVRQISGKLGPQISPAIISHQNHPMSFITGANDMRRWRALKYELQISRDIGNIMIGTFNDELRYYWARKGPISHRICTETPVHSVYTIVTVLLPTPDLHFCSDVLNLECFIRDSVIGRIKFLKPPLTDRPTKRTCPHLQG